MSWKDRLENTKLTIITGDGRQYQPLWKDAERNVSYNNKGFNFVNLDGTYVERKKKQGDQFPLLLWFQGEDCIDQANAFEISARDSRPWKLIHPFLDNEIYVQPLNLKLDQKNYNVVEATLTVWETLLEKYPEQTISTKRQILFLKSQNDAEVAATFAEALPVPAAATVTSSGVAISGIASQYDNITENEVDAQALKNLARGATSAASGIIGDVDFFINQAIALINFPFQAENTIETKLNNLLINIATLETTLLGNNSTADNKVLYQSLATVLFSESCRVAANPSADDYQTRSSVVNVISQIDDAYQDFLSVLDTEEIEQDPVLANQLDTIVNTTLANLSDIAFNSKQERVIRTDKDTNIILLAHKYFGRGDEALLRFIDANDISLSEMIGVKKDREIRYFV